MEKYMPLVRYNAERIWNRLPDGVELDDLSSSGVFGLLDAIVAFDLERGVKFETYCVPRIRGAMLDELRTMDWVPRLVRSKASKLNEATKLLGHLGVEPLNGNFELASFHSGLHKRHSAVKQVLLAGDLVVGVGNIYASEALYLAGIRPTVRADRISRPRADKLRLAIIDVLSRAVSKGGSTLRDFSNADGQQGYFQLEAHVYDRAGEPCRACGTTIRRIQQGQRSTYYCATCQKP
jgi:RNA polymerase sigma factor (sigma-70 family)